MLHITGVLETSLYVEDLARSRQFYRTIFQFQELIADQRFCALRAADQQVLLLFRKNGSTAPISTTGGIIPPHDGTGQLHLAFATSTADLTAWENWLEQHNVTIESQVHWER